MASGAGTHDARPRHRRAGDQTSPRSTAATRASVLTDAPSRSSACRRRPEITAAQAAVGAAATRRERAPRQQALTRLIARTGRIVVREIWHRGRTGAEHRRPAQDRRDVRGGRRRAVCRCRGKRDGRDADLCRARRQPRRSALTTGRRIQDAGRRSTPADDAALCHALDSGPFRGGARRRVRHPAPRSRRRTGGGGGGGRWRNAAARSGS